MLSEKGKIKAWKKADPFTTHAMGGNQKIERHRSQGYFCLSQNHQADIKPGAWSETSGSILNPGFPLLT
jgi:hypothetical protein